MHSTHTHTCIIYMRILEKKNIQKHIGQWTNGAEVQGNAEK